MNADENKIKIVVQFIQKVELKKKRDLYPSGERKRKINWLVIWRFVARHRIKEKGSRNL